MTISPKFAPFLFGLLLSGFMSLIVSGVSTVRVLGVSEEFVGAWMMNWGFSWLIAFPTVLIVAPFVRQIVAKMTKES